MQVPGVYTNQYMDAALSYPSTTYLDDLAYAAAWMYYATKVIALIEKRGKVKFTPVGIMTGASGTEAARG